MSDLALAHSADPGTYEVDLRVQVPPVVAGDFLAKLHYISEGLTGFAFVSDRLDRVRFSLRAADDVVASRTAESIRDIADRMFRHFRDYRPRVLMSSKGAPSVEAVDPHPELEREGEIKPFGRGCYGFGPRLTALMNRLDRAFVQVARRLAAPEHRFPSLIGADTLQRCSYLKSFPHSLNLVHHLREDITSIQKFASQTAASRPGALDFDAAALAPPECLLSPSVCFHWYAWLAGRTLQRPLIITALGKCFRYESGNLTALERLWDFTMREVIFVGPKEFVLATRQEVLELTRPILERWRLGFEVLSATDPFFVEEFAQQTGFQVAFDLKFEIRAALPYKQSTLAVGSLNQHQDFFGRAFDIRDADGHPVHTGCVGYGLERMALAVIAHHGLDPEKWPSETREDLG